MEERDNEQVAEKETEEDSEEVQWPKYGINQAFEARVQLDQEGLATLTKVLQEQDHTQGKYPFPAVYIKEVTPIKGCDSLQPDLSEFEVLLVIDPKRVDFFSGLGRQIANFLGFEVPALPLPFIYENLTEDLEKREEKLWSWTIVTWMHPDAGEELWEDKVLHETFRWRRNEVLSQRRLEKIEPSRRILPKWQGAVMTSESDWPYAELREICLTNRLPLEQFVRLLFLLGIVENLSELDEAVKRCRRQSKDVPMPDPRHGSPLALRADSPYASKKYKQKKEKSA